MASAYIPATPAALPLECPVVVVGPQYCMPHPIDLTVTSKHPIKVTDVNGNVVFTVKGKIFSLHDRCTLLDSVGESILTMQKKIFSAHRRWQVFQGKGRESEDLLFSVKKSSFFQLNTQLDVCLAANASETVPDFKIMGSYDQRTCTIYLGETNTILAEMSMYDMGKSILLGNDVFGVTVYPNVDYTFVVGLIFVLDQINQDRIRLTGTKQIAVDVAVNVAVDAAVNVIVGAIASI